VNGIVTRSCRVASAFLVADIRSPRRPSFEEYRRKTVRLLEKYRVLRVEKACNDETALFLETNILAQPKKRLSQDTLSESEKLALLETL
jgi:hypothetical protein